MLQAARGWYVEVPVGRAQLKEGHGRTGEGCVRERRGPRVGLPPTWRLMAGILPWQALMMGVLARGGSLNQLVDSLQSPLPAGQRAADDDRERRAGTRFDSRRDNSQVVVVSVRHARVGVPLRPPRGEAITTMTLDRQLVRCGVLVPASVHKCIPWRSLVMYKVRSIRKIANN